MASVTFFYQLLLLILHFQELIDGIQDEILVFRLKIRKKGVQFGEFRVIFLGKHLAFPGFEPNFAGMEGVAYQFDGPVIHCSFFCFYTAY